MRARSSILAALVVLALAGTASSAHAAPASIVGGVASPPAPDPNVFSSPTYLHDAGTVATLTWVAGGSHNATATAPGPDGGPLFVSDTIGSGSAQVQGTQYLPVAAYPFTCTIHPGMNAQLNVNAGTPQPRPTIALKLNSKKLAKVASKGKVSVKVTLTGGQEATVSVKLGKKLLGTKTTTKSGTLVVPLSAKGKKALEGKKKASLKVEGTVAFGSPAKATGKLT